MTIRQTQIIEWSTTPKELRAIADQMENDLADDLYYFAAGSKDMELRVYLDLGQWQAEQVEDKD